MIGLVQDNWPLVVVAVLIGLLLAWWVRLASRRTRVTIAGDDGATRGAAQRNQALIDAPAAALSDKGASAGDEDSELLRIKGLGPKLVAILADEGVSTIAQVAAWNEDEIDRIDALLGRFAGRIRRDSWVEQARLLDAGDMAAYHARFGRTD